MFANRQEAGRLLSEKIAADLPHYTNVDLNQYVIGVSRGGILVAAPVCTKLRSPLSIFEAETIVDAERPSKEIAAVSSCGLAIYNDKFRYGHGEQGYVGQQVKESALKARESQKAWLTKAGLEIQPRLSGKRIIIVDDGTTSDMIREAAAITIRSRGATEVVLAAPAICKPSQKRLQGAYNHLVSLETPTSVVATLRDLYCDRTRIDDADVIQMLSQSAIFLQPEDGLEVHR